MIWRNARRPKSCNGKSCHRRCTVYKKISNFLIVSSFTLVLSSMKVLVLSSSFSTWTPTNFTLWKWTRVCKSNIQSLNWLPNKVENIERFVNFKFFFSFFRFGWVAASCGFWWRFAQNARSIDIARSCFWSSHLCGSLWPVPFCKIAFQENPRAGFLPHTGTLQHLSPPEENQHVRVDTGVRQVQKRQKRKNPAQTENRCVLLRTRPGWWRVDLLWPHDCETDHVGRRSCGRVATNGTSVATLRNRWFANKHW